MDNIKLTCGNCALFADEDANGDGWCEYHQMPTNCSDTTNQLENNLKDCFLPKNE